MTELLVKAHNLTKSFQTQGFFRRKGRPLTAVDGVSLEIEKGEVLGLVGESGCGKSTTGKLLLRLLEPDTGQVFFGGEEITSVGRTKLQDLRRQMQMIFQDPYSSLNPRQSAGEIIAEPLAIHNLGNKRERKERVAELLELVGLEKKHADRLPHELSGGQRQRVGIARALAVEPSFIVADEAVSSLDVSMRAQILNLLKDLQKKLELTYLFIAHDLSIVRYLSQRVAVMYLGQIVEMGDTRSIFYHPQHPYTRSLLAAVTIPDPDVRPERSLPGGEVPSLTELPGGCRFHNRCSQKMERCTREEPQLQRMGKAYMVRCHRAGESSASAQDFWEITRERSRKGEILSEVTGQ